MKGRLPPGIRRRFLAHARTPSLLCSQGHNWRMPIETLETRKLLSANITQFHYDPSSTGQDLSETVLTPTNVNATDFGRQFITQLDGQVYAQPLAVQSIDITRVGSNSTESTGVHNVLYVATMHDSLFAIDADTGAILWQDSFLQIDSPEVTTNLSPAPTAGVIPFPLNTASGGENAGINANDVSPEEGVFGTPVIDPKTDILYCIAYTQERRNDTSASATPSATGTDWHFVERLWAINLADGSVAIKPTLPAGAPVPAAMGQTIADTCLNYTGSTFPTFSSFTGYEYYAGPYVKGSGDNGDSATSSVHDADTDGWVTNPNDLTTNSAHSAFAGTTPYAQGDIAVNAILEPSRTGLMLLNGVIYFGMTSHGDQGPYYGFVLGYNASTLQNVAAFATAPTWENYDIISGSNGDTSGDDLYDNQGAIWGGEQSITTDGTYLYMSLGNGAFDWTSTNFPANGTNTTTDDGNKVQLPLDGDYGNATLKLAVDPNANQGGLSITSLPTTFNPDGTSPGVNGQNVNGYGLKVTDFFVASNTIYLNFKDLDVGSGGVLLIPNNVTSKVPGHVGDPMLVTGGKEGRVYLIDRDDMGGFDTSYFSNNATDASATYANGTAVFGSPGNGVPNQGPDAISYDRVLGEYEGLGAFFTIPSFYMNGSIPTLVIDGNGVGVRTFNLNTFQYTTSTLPANDSNNPVPLGITSTTFANHGSTSAISASGSSNPIAWNIDTQNSPANDDLLAFNLNALDSSGTTALAPLYNSNTDSSTDSLTGYTTASPTTLTATKFSVPSIFNGMVYVGVGAGWGKSNDFAKGAIVGYGLRSSYLTSSSSLFGAPTTLAGNYTAGAGIQLGWTRNSTVETESEIDRSTNGTFWSALAYVSNGASSYIDSTAAPNTTYFYRVRAISGANSTAYATSSAIVTGTPPEVAGVSVDSTSWSSKFPYAGGYPIPTGTSQLTDLPWINLNQVNIQFNEDVNVAQDDLTVDGVNTPSYTISNFSYNATTFTATWTLGSSIGADKLLLDLSGTGTNAVTSATGNVALDGTWTNGSSTFPSGNNAPGTDFKFDLNVLPGDVKQTGGPVTILDVIAVRNEQLTSAGGAGYSPLYDVDGSGSINILDVVDVRNRQLSSLPSGTPSAVIEPAKVARSSKSSSAKSELRRGRKLSPRILA